MLAAEFGSSRMSGSGSAVFARIGLPCSQASEAELSDKMQRLMATAPADWMTRLCLGLDAHPLVEWVSDQDSTEL
jgi:4-diphosphocytidyl-2-C-methyl-D-erythritol kinase